eukprot:557855-Pleurochrysis_carterae.AAC.2
MERKRRCGAVRRGRVKQRIISNKVPEVKRSDPVHPGTHIVMVRVRGGHCQSGSQGAFARSHRKSASAMELSDESERSKAGFKRG